jgi:hypothetical protein
LQQGVVDVLSAISLLERLKGLESQSLLTPEQMTVCEQFFKPYISSYNSTPLPPQYSFGVLDKDKYPPDEAQQLEGKALTGKLSLKELGCITNDEEVNDDE